VYQVFQIIAATACNHLAPRAAYGSTIAQTATGDGVYIRLHLLEFDQDDNFVGFRVGCDIVDDGEFEMPTSLQLTVFNSGNRFDARYTRNISEIRLLDGIVVARVLVWQSDKFAIVMNCCSRAQIVGGVDHVSKHRTNSSISRHEHELTSLLQTALDL
jgi:hypothetical protein